MIETSVFFEQYSSGSTQNTQIDFKDCVDVSIINNNAFTIYIDTLAVIANTTVVISCNEGEILTGAKNVYFKGGVGSIQVIKRKINK